MPDNLNTETERPVEPAPAAAAAEPAANDPTAAQPEPAPQAPAADQSVQLAALQARNQELVDQFLRSQAEMQNVRRRADEEVAKARKYALESFAESLLPVCDSLEAGLHHQDQTVEQIRAGAEATLRQLKAALERNKVLEINPAVATKFDPHQHQAIAVVPAEQEANTVVTVLQKGYSIAERVLRPALVTVTAPK